MRRVLFVHTNFPGQFLHLARALCKNPGWSVAAIGSATAKPMQGVRLERYDTPTPVEQLDPVAGRFTLDSRRGEAAARSALRLRDGGFVPDVVVGHTGWGELLYLRDVFPGARFVSYLEFYFSFEGADVNFDPEFPPRPDNGRADTLSMQAALQVRNASVLISAVQSDILVAPTAWQASRFPSDIRGRINILHEGVDTERLSPHDGVRLELPNGRFVRTGDEILTYVARNLEPYRGFHRLMRALPDILRERPEAQVLIIGGDEVSYGRPAAGGRGWRQALLDEVGGRLDMNRVHFLGRVPYDAYIGALQISRVHVYLTYPFVLSWSLVEAMSCGAYVVASDTAPVREIITDGQQGRLVGFFDHDALVRSVVAGLAAERDQSELRARARERVLERYRIDASVSGYLAFMGASGEA